MPVFRIEQQDEDNPLDLCELRVEPACAQEIELRLQLLLGVSEISLDTSLYRVGVSSATLALNLDGLKTKVGSKAGAFNSVAAEIEKSQRSELRNKKAAAIQAVLTSRSLSLSGQTSVVGEKTSEEALGIASSVTHSGIRLQPHDKWKVEDPRGKESPLDTTILNGERLCVLEAKPQANRYSCQIIVYAASAEFQVTQKIGGRRTTNVNRERVLGVIATRSISGEDRYDAATTRGVVLSRADILFGVKDV